MNAELQICPRCQNGIAEDFNYCSRCGLALTDEGRTLAQEAMQRIADQAVQNSVAINPNTFAGYLQTPAGTSTIRDVLGFFREWLGEAHRGYRATLWIFAGILVVFVSALVVLAETNTLTPSAGTVFGLLIGFVLAKIPGSGAGGGGGSGSSTSQSQPH